MTLYIYIYLSVVIVFHIHLISVVTSSVNFSEARDCLVLSSHEHDMFGEWKKNSPVTHT